MAHDTQKTLCTDADRLYRLLILYQKKTKELFDVERVRGNLGNEAEVE